MYIYLPLIIMGAGALLYIVLNDKISELGRIMFFVGLFVWLLGVAK